MSFFHQFMHVCGQVYILIFQEGNYLAILMSVYFLITKHNNPFAVGKRCIRHWAQNVKGPLSFTTYQLCIKPKILPYKCLTCWRLCQRILWLSGRGPGGGGGGGGTWIIFWRGCASRNPEMGVLRADYKHKNIGSLELQKPWNGSLGGLIRSRLKPQNTWTLELPKTYYFGFARLEL